MLFRSKPGGRLTFIHQDDLADLYVRVVEKGLLVRGQIFDAANDSTDSTDDVLARMTEVSGTKEPYEYVQPSNGEQLSRVRHKVVIDKRNSA